MSREGRVFVATKFALTVWIIGSFITIFLVKLIFRDYAVPFGLFEFWKIKLSLWSAIKASWLLFAWAFVVTVVRLLFLKIDADTSRYAEDILIWGFIKSSLAGIQEEILFRWLVPLNLIWAVKLSNFVLLGWIGCIFSKLTFLGIPRAIFLLIRGFLADILTLGRMHSILYHPLGWFVGAAVLAANKKFRNGHKYQGTFGYINSWFVGMYFFWLLFNYGLVAAIVMHFLYDMFIFVVGYFRVAIDRAKRKHSY